MSYVRGWGTGPYLTRICCAEVVYEQVIRELLA